MAGRRRSRALSTSTVATVDEHSIQYLKENQVIRPAPPGGRSDEWPCFLLTEATVYDRHGSMANLLHVDLEGPFMVRGLLNVEPDQGGCLARGYMRLPFVWIEIPRTYAYSIGLKEDAKLPVLWAAGESAHFEIVPSERYTPIANIMFQGVSLHYHVLDLYEKKLENMERLKPRKKKRGLRIQDVDLPIQDIFFSYATAVGDGSTLEEVTQRCRDQAAFLLSQFPKGTGFHIWLSDEYPDLVQRLGNKLDSSAQITFTQPELPERKPATSRSKSSSAESQRSKRNVPAEPKQSAPRSRRGSSKVQAESIESSNIGPRNPRGRPSKEQRRTPLEPVEVQMHDFAHKPMTLPARAKLDLSASAPPATTQSALSALIEVLEDGRVKALADWKTGAKQKKHPDNYSLSQWQTKMYKDMSISVYAARAEILQYHAGGLAQHLGPEWHNSDLYKWAKDNAGIKPKYEHITEQHIQRIIRRNRNPNIAHRDLAGASRTPAETSGKQLPRGRPSGKAAGLRPSLGSSKRPRNHSDNEDEEMSMDNERPPRKTAKTSQFFDDGEDEELADTDGSTEGEHDSEDMEPMTRVAIITESLPSSTPRGPNNTWICDEPDCGYIVRSAADEEGQELIRQHYEEHEKELSDEAKERELSQVNLAMQESRGHLPINHLLDKIRQATHNKQKPDQEELNGQVIPQPIKRSLLV